MVWRGLQARVPEPQIKKLELVSVGLGKFWQFDVGTEDPIVLFLKPGDEMVPDESNRSGDQ